MLASATVVEVLTQAVLVHPMLAARWRWNCNRALIVPRSRGGQRRPIHLQRMDADDVLAAAWPGATFLPALRRGNVHGALDMGLDMKEFEEERKAKSHECFLKRNVIFASRDLITL